MNPNLSEKQFGPKASKTVRATYHFMTKVVPAVAAANVISAVVHGLR